jgi:hypothetical protein
MRNVVGLASVLMVGVALAMALGGGLDVADMFESVSRHLEEVPASRSTGGW